jgi:Family of unknown function (DUF6152)
MSKKTATRFALASIVTLTLLSAGLPARAHHSIAGQFDMTKTVRLTGVVKRLDWVNPHVYLFLEAKNAEGEGDVWKLETLPVAMLRKAGIKKQMLVTGETVELDVCPARNGTEQLGFILNIKFPDGKRFQFSRDPNGTVSAVP